MDVRASADGPAVRKFLTSHLLGGGGEGDVQRPHFFLRDVTLAWGLSVPLERVLRVLNVF